MFGNFLNWETDWLLNLGQSWFKFFQGLNLKYLITYLQYLFKQ